MPISPMHKNLIALSFVFLVLAQASMAMHRKHIAGTNEVESARIEYGPCYGRCGMYSIAVNRDGLVTYTGIRFVSDTGVYTRHIEVTEALRILHLFNQYRADTCQVRCVMRIPDMQSWSFTVDYHSGTEQRIINANFGPGYLKLLAAELNAIGKHDHPDGWQKSGNK